MAIRSKRPHTSRTTCNQLLQPTNEKRSDMNIIKITKTILLYAFGLAIGSAVSYMFFLGLIETDPQYRQPPSYMRK